MLVSLFNQYDYNNFESALNHLTKLCFEEPEFYKLYNEKVYRNYNMNRNIINNTIIHYIRDYNKNKNFNKDNHFPYSNMLNKLTYGIRSILKTITEKYYDIISISIKNFEHYFVKSLYLIDYADFSILKSYISQYIDHLSSKYMELTTYYEDIFNGILMLADSIILDTAIIKYPEGENNISDYILRNKYRVFNILTSNESPLNTFNQLTSYTFKDYFKTNDQFIDFLKYATNYIFKEFDEPISIIGLKRINQFINTMYKKYFSFYCGAIDYLEEFGYSNITSTEIIKFYKVKIFNTSGYISIEDQGVFKNYNLFYVYIDKFNNIEFITDKLYTSYDKYYLYIDKNNIPNYDHFINTLNSTNNHNQLLEYINIK